MPEKPRSSYVICTTPRSGSWMLCSLLAQTGIAGRPSEYFGPTLYEEILSNRYAVRAKRTRDYFDAVIAASTSANGVCGTKILANMTPLFMRRAAEHLGRPFTSLKEALDAEFPRLHYILLTRDNKVAQAISYYRGMMTGIWRREHGGASLTRTAVGYDHFAIERSYEDVIASDAYWDAYFKTHGIEPLRLTYETLTADFESETRRVLAHLGLPSDMPISPPKTAKLADERSLAWEAEFRKQGLPPVDISLSPTTYWAPF